MGTETYNTYLEKHAETVTLLTDIFTDEATGQKNAIDTEREARVIISAMKAFSEENGNDAIDEALTHKANSRIGLLPTRVNPVGTVMTMMQLWALPEEKIFGIARDTVSKTL